MMLNVTRRLPQAVPQAVPRLHRGWSDAAQSVSSTAPAPTDERSAFGYCAQLVREHDRNNFIWVTQLPKGLRARVLALRAFNLETLLIGQHIKSKEKPLVQIRFQWWRDALCNLFDGRQPPAHPVLVALAAVHAQTPLSRYQLRRLLDNREIDELSEQPPLTMAQLEDHVEGTASQLHYLQLSAAGVADRHADHAASHVGKAVGLATLLRGTPFHASKRRSYLPLEVCARHQVSQEELFRGEPPEGLRDVALEVASVARAHLQEARSLTPRIPRAATKVLLSATGAGIYLDALEKKNFDLFDPRLVETGGASPLWYTLSLKFKLIRGRF